MTSALAIPERTALQQRPTQLQRTQEQHLTVLLAELARLGEARQVVVSEQTFAIYAEELASCHPEDVKMALRKIAREPRPQFQTAFPPLADVLVHVRQAREQRIKASFPPPPVRPAALPPLENVCAGSHHYIGGKRMVYVGGVLQLCQCCREQMRQVQEHQATVMTPYYTTFYSWQDECNAIRQRIMQEEQWS